MTPLSSVRYADGLSHSAFQPLLHVVNDVAVCVDPGEQPLLLPLGKFSTFDARLCLGLWRRLFERSEQ